MANHPNVIAKDIAESLGIHLVMLYRWRMEYKNGNAYILNYEDYH